MQLVVHYKELQTFLQAGATIARLAVLAPACKNMRNLFDINAWLIYHIDDLHVTDLYEHSFHFKLRYLFDHMFRVITQVGLGAFYACSEMYAVLNRGCW